MAGNVVTKTFEVRNKMGLHARPAALLVRLVADFQSAVTVEKNGESADCRSILSLMMLSAGKGTVLNFHAEGPDCEEVLLAIGRLFEQKFDEE